MACYKESLSEEETHHLVQQTQELLAYQEAEDEEEAKRIVPHLSLCDIKREAEAIETEFFRLGQIPCWFVPASCSQILYLKAYWDLSGLPLRLYPYASILASVLGRMDTEHFTYEDLSSEIHIRTGGMSVSVNVLERMDHSFRVEMQVDAKSLVSESEVMTSLVLEILRTTKLDDEKRLREILDEEYTQMESEMDEARHASALQRAMAGLSKAALAGQYLSGVDYFLFIKELLHHFEERKEELIASLNEVRDRVFLQSGMELVQPRIVRHWSNAWKIYIGDSRQSRQRMRRIRRCFARRRIKKESLRPGKYSMWYRQGCSKRRIRGVCWWPGRF